MENNLNIEDIMKSVTAKYTPEYFEELEKKSYEDDRNYPENFSNWYNHIVDFGKFKHVDIIANQIFTLEEIKIMREVDQIDLVDWDKINSILKPTLDKMEDYKVYNIKNGCFSNKFDFSTCLTTKKELAKKLWQINYVSTMYDTGGYTELVVRDMIPRSTPEENMTIYNGMPLREEIRVFYNMETKSIEYIVDYWDYNYCAKNLRNISDKIVFDYFHNKIGNRAKILNHDEYLQNVLFNMVEEYIPTLKFDNCLEGIWSIDFLWEDGIDIYLIDMARGCRSAYWDITKCKSYKEENHI